MREFAGQLEMEVPARVVPDCAPMHVRPLRDEQASADVVIGITKERSSTKRRMAKQLAVEYIQETRACII